MAIEITKNIYMLELSANSNGRSTKLHPSLLQDEHEVILVDTGYAGMLDLIEQELALTGVNLSRITRILLTHQDMDHIGGLPDLLSHLNQNVEVLSSAAEKPYIQGEKPLIKANNPDNRPTAQIDRTIEHDEILPFADGLKVISTPGHSPGHLCIYHEASKTLIAGDAMTVVDGELMGPNPAYTPDMKQAIQSLEQLLPYEINQVICYHGGLYQGNAVQRIAQIIDSSLADS
ncbi:MBL fold metallo-hydrolase [Neobacillus mesonae]|nr:MBL fold metallo-hydrolase [Neobacillus mesonae]